MRVVDASSIVYGWDNYPIDQFPAFWVWMEGEIASGNLQLSTVAFDEVNGVSPDCAEWLRCVGVQRLPVTNEILMLANSIKSIVGVVGDGYHPKGVGENDLIIIATAMELGVELVSDEARQKSQPKERRKMRIPAVCGLPEVSVDCINFVEYIKQSKESF